MISRCKMGWNVLAFVIAELWVMIKIYFQNCLTSQKQFLDEK